MFQFYRKTMSFQFSKIFNFAFYAFFIALFFMTIGCSKNKIAGNPTGGLNAKEKRQKNIAEGNAGSLGSLIKNRGSTNYQFSSSNPLWRASLETLDFLPLTTVDYSGGVIITDWYSQQDKDLESIKITLRFLSNEIRSDSIKIIVHKKKCSTQINCVTSLATSDLIKNELRSTILRKASLFEKADKKK